MREHDRPLFALRATGFAALLATAAILLLVLLVAGSAGAQTIARGVPSFELQRNFGDLAVGVAAVASADLNADGLAEVVILNDDGQGAILIATGLDSEPRSLSFNQPGSGVSRVAIGCLLPGSSCTQHAIVVGYSSGQARIYPVTPANQDLTLGDPTALGVSDSAISDILVTNFDGGNTGQDLVFVSDGAVRLYVNGTLAPEAAISVVDKLSTVAVAVLAGDPSPKILVGRTGASESETLVYGYDATNQKLAANPTTLAARNVSALAVTQPDADGQLFFAASNQAVQVYGLKNDGQPFCAEPAATLDVGVRTIRSMVVADLNGDQRDDLIVGGGGGQALIFFRTAIAATCPDRPGAQPLFVKQSDTTSPVADQIVAMNPGAATPQLMLAGPSNVDALTTIPVRSEQATALTLNAAPNLPFAIAHAGAAPDTLFYEGANESVLALEPTTASGKLIDPADLGALAAVSDPQFKALVVLAPPVGSSSYVVALRKSGGAKLFAWNAQNNTITLLRDTFGPLSDPKKPDSFVSVNAVQGGDLDANKALDTLALATDVGVVLYDLSTAGVDNERLTLSGGTKFTAVAFADLLNLPAVEQPPPGEPAVNGVDLIVGQEDGTLTVYLGQQSDRSFAPTDLRRTRTLSNEQAEAVTTLATGEFLPAAGSELFVARISGPVQFYGGDGNAILPLSTALNVSAPYPLVTRLNDDALLDLVLVTSGGLLLTFTNDDNGSFTREALATGVQSRLAAGDLNDDGFVDVIAAPPIPSPAGASPPAPILYTQGLQARPEAIYAGSLAEFQASTRLSEIGDFDLDGTLDLLAIGDGSGKLFRNEQGTGAMREDERAISFAAGRSRALAVGDIDGDLALDAVVGTDTGLVLLWNTRQGTLAPLSNPELAQIGAVTDVRLGYIDDDKQLDLVVARRNAPAQVLYLRSSGAPPAVTIAATAELTQTGVTRSLAVGNLDTDRRSDLVTLNEFGDTIGVYTNLGGSAATPELSLTERLDVTLYEGLLTLADLDNDSDLDLLAVPFYGTAQHFENSVSSSGARSFIANGPIGGSLSTTLPGIGDMNGDGVPDIVSQGLYGIGTVQLQLNSIFFTYSSQCRSLTPTRFRCFGSASGQIHSLHVADMNGDDALDIVTTRSGARNHAIYFNDGAGRTPPPTRLAAASAQQLATGDFDRDGRADLLASDGQLVLWSADRLGLQPKEYPLPSIFTPLMAIGDFNQNGYDDVAVVDGSGAESTILYGRDGPGSDLLEAPAHLQPFGLRDAAAAIASADFDGDDLQDLAVAYWNGQNLLLYNKGLGSERPFAAFDVTPTGDQSVARVAESSGVPVTSLAAIDIDSDGDTDLVVASTYTPHRHAVYLNDGVGGFASSPDCGAVVLCFGNPRVGIQALAVADVDRDGRLDIVAGEEKRPHVVYYQTKPGEFYAGSFDCFEAPSNVRCFGRETASTFSIVAGDLNSDGNTDLAVGTSDRDSAVYLNDGKGALLAARELTPTLIFNLALLEASPNPDGELDLVAATLDGIERFVPRTAAQRGATNNPPTLTVRAPCVTLAAGQPCIFNGNTITAPLRLADPEGDPIRAISVTYSLDGGAQWHAAAGSFTATNAPTTTLISDTFRTDCLGGCLYTYIWSRAANGIFGRSDNVMLRFEVYSAPGTGPVRHPYRATQTTPFRLNGAQIRVLGPPPVPVPGAGCPPPSEPPPEVSTGLRCELVYLPLIDPHPVPPIRAFRELPPRARVYTIVAGQPGELLEDGAGKPYFTDENGYLRGRAAIPPNAGLVALLPLTEGTRYRVYLVSSGIDKNDALTPTPVNVSGTTILTVTRDNPLIVFDLTLSVEWDLSANDPYWDTLKRDLQRTSELLYDWTNGQAVLGKVDIWDNREKWLLADVRVYASNLLRPNASVGGSGFARVEGSGVLPGLVRMSPTWNRYGGRSGVLGEDWPRALAHELGHYLFALHDNYLGFDASGRLVQLSERACPGAMTNPYQEDAAGSGVEFRPEVDWAPSCENTILNRTYGASDWTVLSRVYPWLRAPQEEYSRQPKGPARLLLNLTEVHPNNDDGQDAALVRPAVLYPEQTSESARAFLFSAGSMPDGSDSRIIDLGRPVAGELPLRGARKDDTVCLFDLYPRTPGFEPKSRCIKLETVSGGIPLTLEVAPALWQPEIVVTPVTSRSIELKLVGPDGFRDDNLAATLYTDQGRIPAVPLRQVGATTVYTGLIDVSQGALGGYVHITGSTVAGGRRELVVDYGLGGSPVRGKISGGTENAPVLSPDGQVIIYGPDLSFDEGQFFTMQIATRTRRPPDGRTLVGQAYRLSASRDAPKLEQAFISFSYLSREVPPTEERFLKVYFLDETRPEAQWQPLQTLLVPGVNAASALLPGPGIYALMSSIEIELVEGPNFMAYPVQATRTITEALASIEGKYVRIAEYDPRIDSSRWREFVPGEGGRDDLVNLRFGYGYYILMREAATLYLRGVGAENEGDFDTELDPPRALLVPLPADAITMDAPLILGRDGVACGQARVVVERGQAYALALLEPTEQGAACRLDGRPFQLTRDGRVLATAQPQPAPVRLEDSVPEEGD